MRKPENPEVTENKKGETTMSSNAAAVERMLRAIKKAAKAAEPEFEFFRAKGPAQRALLRALGHPQSRHNATITAHRKAIAESGRYGG